ncbi:hypothetical protein [Devosia sp. SD17-2]|uniref:hypothetical protein n=1 Tax=Devosia sp. SD17-2 TaxID=2976459 RepID=UPI0023D81AC1|nr:hypothetical protein [Devosia sp. SD17-2]WEJ33875.1 hypothetical protein NYQ88_03410 [Devosia sp. SD17-2]
MSLVREKRDIEWLVNWALEKQGVLRGAGGGEAGGGGPAWMTLGTVISGGGGGSDGRWMHDDAMVIGQELLAMAGDERLTGLMALVKRYGMTGTRPDWGAEGCGRYVLVRKRGGKATRRYADQRQARGLMGFEFAFEGSTMEEIEHHMIQYAGWWEALGALRDRINPLMRAYEATGPRAPEAPWDAPERVLHEVSNSVVGVR